NNDHFSDLPQVRSISFAPSFYYYPSEQKEWKLGLLISKETRIGGDMDAIDKKASPQHSFFEENKSDRFAIKLSYDNESSETTSFHLKNSVSYFKRDLLLSNYQFSGKQYATFSEATYNL